LILNTDKFAGSGGIHWQCIYSRHPSTAYFFDSFGDVPKGKEILKFLQRFKKVYYSTSKSQDKRASTCGNYCVYVLEQLHQGRSFNQIVQEFKKRRDDDAFVRAAT